MWNRIVEIGVVVYVLLPMAMFALGLVVYVLGVAGWAAYRLVKRNTGGSGPSTTAPVCTTDSQTRSGPSPSEARPD
jgi:hypothetical protein